MAQAARLNLRMQKELKLLMTDPPPGVSLPRHPDNDNLASPSLTSIEARIEGPEGTVYSKGVFTVKIQIPERYPFQPPNVTFATPIYHPNIDNGGRICLDILNLPPKGAWQPSLNISTVLTSIGLLLSEPNPDDGLMAEASREYKYNKQVFDQKALSWTEMYASSGASATSNNIVHSAKQSEMETERVEVAAVDENDGRRKKLHLGEKLSLKFTVPLKTNFIDEKENVSVQAEVDRAEATSKNIDQKVGRRKKLQLAEKLSVESSLPAETNCPDDTQNVSVQAEVDRAAGTSEKVGRRKKLHLVEKPSLKSSLLAKTFCADDKENVEPQTEVDRAEVISRNIDQNEGRQKKIQLGEKPSLEPTIPVKPNCIDRKDTVEVLCKEVKRGDATSRNVDAIEGRRKKLHLGEKLSLNSKVPLQTKHNVEKENVAAGWLTLSWSESPPTGTFSSPVVMDADNRGDKSVNDHAQKAPNGNRKQDAGPPNGIETIIVSDSEESEDESIIVSRPRFPLMRRRMLGKRKGTH